MVLVLVSTPGSTTANSYSDLTFADAYFLAHPAFRDWDVLDSPTKERNLILATTQIDAMMDDAQKYDTDITAGVPDQALCFPRRVDTYGSSVYIPIVVKRATCEQALYLQSISGGSTSKRTTLQNEGVSEITIGDVTERYDLSKTPANAHELSPRAYQMLNNAGLIQHTAGWA